MSKTALITSVMREDGVHQARSLLGHAARLQAGGIQLGAVKLCQLGWAPKIDLETGLRATYQWFVGEQAAAG